METRIKLHMHYQPAKTVVLLIFTYLCISLLYSCVSSQPKEELIDELLAVKDYSIEILKTSHTPFIDHSSEILALENDLQNIYIRLLELKESERAVEQWENIIDAEGDSLGTALLLWKEKEEISTNLLSGLLIAISDAFDNVIELVRALPMK